MSIFGSSARRAISLLPFGYYAVTRIPGWRDFAFLIASSWLPVIWIILRLGHGSIRQALLVFTAGYLAFIAIYEVGYLVNDVWDSRKSPAGRPRSPFQINSLYVSSFLLVRLAIWMAVGIETQWIADRVWLSGFALLAVTIAIHNLISARVLRVSSFYGLAIFRFAMPAIASIPTGALPVVFIAASLFYALPRTLSYMDSKDLLRMPDRKNPNFTFLFFLILSPITILIAVTTSVVLLELLIYMLFVSAFWAVAYRAAAPGKADDRRLEERR